MFILINFCFFDWLVFSFRIPFNVSVFYEIEIVWKFWISIFGLRAQKLYFSSFCFCFGFDFVLFSYFWHFTFLTFWRFCKELPWEKCSFIRLCLIKFYKSFVVWYLHFDFLSWIACLLTNIFKILTNI